MDKWQFLDPPNVAVFTCKQIVEREKWIHYVSHDEEDGAWQFHTSDPNTIEDDDMITVSLKSIYKIDPSIAELSDLPLGWHAWRESQNSPWQREKMDFS